ncbi:MAG TPA: hypothetical protein PKM44_15480 [Turneriella sp.]|nr:hypothetical protein [Turneriella sp.]HNE21215.1 hypothetical protein [Turneriella sp.]HNL11913.1 hypothetical protein [Turneriella sp.]HNN01459.1 hypothetical protein [Turneriella sp.]
MERAVVISRAKLGEDNSLAEHYRSMNADERMQDFLKIQQTYLVAMGYTEFPPVERVIQFRKMNCH